MFTLKQRALISGVIAVGIVLVLTLWPMPAWRGALPTPILVISQTSFGPVLLMLLPVLAAWVTFAAETSIDARFGFAISFALFVICLIIIWYAKEVYRLEFGPIG